MDRILISGVVAVGAIIPLIILILTETRAPVIIRRRASKLRKERALADGGRYTARSEIGRQKFLTAMSTSLLRPLCKFRHLEYCKSGSKKESIEETAAA